ncbi:MAG: molybdopterin-dependent oxidoreductase [Dehalococcoidales bacterium]|nr:molybdopterin-dependent oxidoreductase [Dehalococcoidales bacterium]
MKKTVIQVAVVVVLVAAVLYGASRFTTPLTTRVAPLEAVEVREYEGEDLSSVYQFSENSIRGVQKVDIARYRLNIDGLVQNPLTFTYDDVLENYQHYKKTVILDCVEGWSVRILWEGVLVKDLLAKAGVKPEAKTVIFHAYDTYTTSFPIEYLLDNNIIMAYKMNEITMPPERGYPFALVAESKWGYKWIKWITRIELSDDVNYQGFWESRGYSNSGDLDKNFFE